MQASFFKLKLASLGPLALFIIVYCIDNRLGSLAIYPIYLAPILLINSKWGWPIASLFAVLAAFLSTQTSAFLSEGNNQAYFATFMIRSTTLITLSLLYSNCRGIISSQKQRLDRLIAIVPQCPDCGAIFCCDGQWRSLEQIISEPNAYTVLRKHDCYGNEPRSKL